MFEREKLSGTNFNDWLRRLKLVLIVKKKMFVIEQPIPPAPAANSEANVLVKWNALYDAYNEELKSMFEKQAGVESKLALPVFQGFVEARKLKPRSTLFVVGNGVRAQVESYLEVLT
ncbi:hypothetical protein Tco_1352571 [Tanacetum coccineum]